MNINRIAALAVPLVIVGLMGFTLLMMITSPRPPSMPGDETHDESEDGEGCLECHDSDAPDPWPESHPPAKRCRDCHA